VGTWWFHSVR